MCDDLKINIKKIDKQRTWSEQVEIFSLETVINAFKLR